MSTQQDFVNALFDEDHGCPEGLTTWNGSDPAMRFAVYRNNVMVSLIDALADTFPAVQELVGVPFFRCMARQFVFIHPPRSRILAYYGQEFPFFIERFQPAALLPYLADVARLEMLRVLAYHAADASALSREEINAVLGNVATLPELRFLLHPSLAVLQSKFATVSLWGAHQGLLEIETVDPAVPQTALVVRIGLDVNVVGIDAATGHFIEQLRLGATLSEAAASTVSPEFDLARSLSVLMRWQAISALKVSVP